MPDYARACRPPDYAPNYAIMPSIMARALHYASVTYTDHLVGMLLDKLAALGHEDDTVVGLIGDHGWQVNPFPGLVLAQAVLDGLQDLSARWLPLRTARRAQYLGQTHELRAW